MIVVLTNRPATISVELFFGMLRPFVDVARARQSVGLPQSVFGDTLTFTSPPVRERGDGRIEIPLTANTDGRIIIGEDPGPDSIARAGCSSGAHPPPAGDTTELARRIGADPDFETTDTQPVSIAGLDGLQVDGTFRALDLCYGMWSPSRNGDGGGGPRVHQPTLEGGWRIRVYMVDYPEWALSETNWRPRVLTVAVIAPENDFEGVLERAAPIIDSLEFRPG